MLAVIVIAILAAVLSPAINWLAIIWMVIAAMWVVTARSNQLTAEDWKQLYGTQSNAFNTLRQRWNSTIDELVELRGKYQALRGKYQALYQALDDEYLKLAKQNEATSKENAQLHERVDALSKERSDYADKYLTSALDLDNANRKVEELTQALEAKKTQSKTTRKKKEDYTEQEKARIKNEMKAGGLINDED